MKTVRCFLAVNIELKAAKIIAELQQELIADSREFESKIKWVPPQNMHITVRFLGNITEPMIQVIKDNLEPITKTSSPFTMETGKIGLFDANDLRVLYSGIKENKEGLTRLVERTHEVLENTGFKEVPKPYTPHVTLARIKDAVQEELDQLIAAHPEINCDGSLVRDLACYQSMQTEEGVDYKLLWKLPLKKRTKPKEPTREVIRNAEIDTEDDTTDNDPSSSPSADKETTTEPTNTEQPASEVVQKNSEQGE